MAFNPDVKFMKKLQRKRVGQGPISQKIISALRKTTKRKLIDISEWKNAKIHADKLQNSVITEKDLSMLDPLHGVYAYAQNKLSVFVEQLDELPALSKLTNVYADAEDLYLPSGPPFSPLTKSYFTCWGFFDLCVGIKKESLGTVVIDVCRELNMDQTWITLFECMQNSRMGFYIHEGFCDGFVLLKEFITQKQIKVIVPSGYSGEKGQIWFARIMPEPFPELNYGYSVVFITPYVITEIHNGRVVFSSETNWISFFERNLVKTKIKDTKQAYEFLMKFGLNRYYWNEYVFEGYVNHTDNMIFLAGFPDISLSRPHSRENSERF